MMQKLDIKAAPMTSEMTVVVARSKTWNAAENALWELEANKSEPRDLRCSWCDELVVMSNAAFADYGALADKPRICCIVCLPNLPQGAPS
jgi:hypothetical protein